MSRTKDHLEDLVEQGKICPHCFSPECENWDECGEMKAREESEIYAYLNR